MPNRRRCLDAGRGVSRPRWEHGARLLAASGVRAADVPLFLVLPDHEVPEAFPDLLATVERYRRAGRTAPVERDFGRPRRESWRDAAALWSFVSAVALVGFAMLVVWVATGWGATLTGVVRWVTVAFWAGSAVASALVGWSAVVDGDRTRAVMWSGLALVLVVVVVVVVALAVMNGGVIDLPGER